MADRQDKALMRPDCAQTLALLGAAGFMLRGPEIIWDDPALAGQALGFPQTHLPRSTLALGEMLSDNAKQIRASALSALNFDGATYKVHYEVSREDGTCLTVEERGRRLGGEGKTPSLIRGAVRDITEERHHQDTLAYRMHYDSQTGLWNRQRAREAIQYLADLGERFNRPGALLIFRLADLSGLNATYGYSAADQVLQEIARTLSAEVIMPDFVARLTASAFIVGLCDCPDDAALNAALSQLEEKLTSSPVLTPFGRIMPRFITAGLAVDCKNFSATLAIETLLSATARGRDSRAADPVFRVPEERLNLSHVDVQPARLALDPRDIMDALSDNRISLMYQPVVEAQSRRTDHFECLIRMRGVDGRLIPAGEFIPLAEKHGIVHLLDRRALDLAAQLLRKDPNIRLALNISAATIRNDLAVAEYMQILRGLGPSASRLILELTETVAVEDPARASQFSASARGLGCRFSIDDFGAGHTTFQNLMAIEADEIKIDGSFIRELSTSPHKQAFVRIMVDLAQTFSVKTVAEFVSRPEDADMLTRFGVDYLQGYLFGAPTASAQMPRAGREVAAVQPPRLKSQ